MRQKFPYIWILLFALLISGCRENYLAEKGYYQANKVLKSVTKADLEADPDKALKPAIEAFEKVAEKYPSTSKAAESLFKVADLYAGQKKFDEARRTLAKIIQNFTGRGDWASNARFKTPHLF